ncbi:Protein of unknown function [Gryllus bimaculatus]|nr:Protein of unknown function [Gryllus bimaculatus]
MPRGRPSQSIWEEVMDPTPEDDPLLGVRWKPYTAEERNFLEIGPQLRNGTDLYADRDERLFAVICHYAKTTTLYEVSFGCFIVGVDCYTFFVKLNPESTRIRIKPEANHTEFYKEFLYNGISVWLLRLEVKDQKRMHVSELRKSLQGCVSEQSH